MENGQLEIPPARGFLAWATRVPGRIRSAYVLLAALASAKATVVKVGQEEGGFVFYVSGDQSRLQLPLRFSSKIENVAVYSASASATYSQSEMNAVMDQLEALTTKQNALLDALESNGINKA